MKLYTFAPAPNPRRVHMFLAEKGIEVEEVEVAIRDGANLAATYTTVNPLRTVPVLELEDGRKITESVAICRYFEAVQPEPPLFGTTPLEKGMIENWHRRVELEGMQAVAEALRNTSPRFEDRAIAGPRNFAQIPALAERGFARLGFWFEDLNAHLKDSPFVAGETFSMADISAYITVNFARMVKTQPDEITPASRTLAGRHRRPSLVSGWNVSGWRTRAGTPISLVPSRPQRS